MDALLLRYLRKQTTEDENRSVAAWRNDSADGERVLADLRGLIHTGQAADLTVDPGDPPPAEHVVWWAETRRVQSTTRRRPAPVRLVHFGGWIAAAAAAVVGFALWNVSTDSPARPGALPTQEIITASGETAMVRLDDGSVIRLGPESRLTTRAGQSAREVTLHGEAFFAVATDEEQSFRVIAAAGTARVLGTRFHLAAQAEELAVAVVEGRVALAGTDQEVEVGAGQSTRLVRGSFESVVTAPPNVQGAEWLRDFLIFQDTPLAMAMREVGQRYDTEVEISDPSLVERTLTMWFNSKSLDEVMTVVCGVIDATCGIGEGVVRIQARDSGAEA